MPFISSKKDRGLMSSPWRWIFLVWLRAIRKPPETKETRVRFFCRLAISLARFHAVSRVRFDIYLMLPTLGRGSLTRITTFTTFLQRTNLPLCRQFDSFFFSLLDFKDSRPSQLRLPLLYYPLLFVRCRRYSEAVDNSTPLLTRSFGCSRTF
ncbi:hypothetical protein CCMA1212_003236 [Trichoderma ghanense]|uniref:Uncharacterized protein n=1 Tax=Trichoderma ghanense TaxID=65468 RepID=A0ABY2HA77_9HYPO